MEKQNYFECCSSESCCNCPFELKDSCCEHCINLWIKCDECINGDD